MKKIYAVSILAIFLVFGASLVRAESSSGSNKLYVTVIEQVGSAAKQVSNARVSVAYGVIGMEQTQQGKWFEVLAENGQVAFSDVTPGVYTISAKAVGYFSAEKEFKKESNTPGYVSITLTKAPADAVGSVQIAVLVQAPQSPIALTTATIKIFKGDKFVASGDTKNTKAKEGVTFSKLSIGEDYRAVVTAPDYESKTVSFAIEPNKAIWLPIEMTHSGAPKGGDVNAGAGFSSEPGALIVITPDEALQKVSEQAIFDDSEKTIASKEVDGKPFYEVNGVKAKRILFIFPVKMQARAIVNAETGVIEKISKPWWSFLAW